MKRGCLSLNSENEAGLLLPQSEASPSIRGARSFSLEAALWSGVPGGDQLLHDLLFGLMLLLGKIEQIGQGLAVWQPRALFSQLIEVRVEQA